TNMDGVQGIRFAVAGSGTVRDNTSTNPIPFPMSDPTSTDDPRVNASAGHLSVHLDSAQAVEVPFLFEQQPRRLGFSIVASAALDLAFAALLVFLSRLPVSPVTAAPV